MMIALAMPCLALLLLLLLGAADLGRAMEVAVATGVFGAGADVKSYLLGAHALAGSLIKWEVPAARVLLTTREAWASVGEELQQQTGSLFEIVFVDPIECRLATEAHNEIYGIFSKDSPGIRTTCTKLHVFGLTQYDKVLFMDADTVALSDVSWVFSWPSVFAAAADPCQSYMFNSGVMLLQPSDDTLAALLDVNRHIGSFDGGDQGILNAYFSTWYGSRAAALGAATLPPHMNVPAGPLGMVRDHYARVLGGIFESRGLRSGLIQAAAVYHFMGSRKEEKPWAITSWEMDEGKSVKHATLGIDKGNQWNKNHYLWPFVKEWQRHYLTAVDFMYRGEGRGGGGGEGLPEAMRSGEL